MLLVRGERTHADRRGVLLALAIAGTIAGYTLTDNQGIEHASAIAYLELRWYLSPSCCSSAMPPPAG